LALGEMGPKAKDAVPALVNALADDRPDVRREVLICLGHIGPDAKSLPAITAQLDHKDDSVKAAAVFAIAKMGPEAAPALPKLEQQLTTTNELLQTVAAWAVARIQPNNAAALDKSLPILVQSLTRKDAAVRTAALRALLDLRPGPDRVLPVLHRILENADPAQLDEALDALATIGEPALPGITLALKRPESRLRAVSILGRMGPKAASAVPALLEVYQDPTAGGSLRREVVHTLGAIGPAAAAAVPALAAALEDPDSRLRHNAGIALGRIGKPAASAAPALEKALAVPDDEYLTLVCAWALLKVQPDDLKLRARTIPLIAKALGDAEPTVRRGAAEALGALGADAKVAVPNLQKLLQDPDPSVREAAQAALAKIGS
jgi:HEAT repeat protein